MLPICLQTDIKSLGLQRFNLFWYTIKIINTQFFSF